MVKVKEKKVTEKTEKKADKNIYNGTYQITSLAQIIPSKNNYRKTFDKKAQEELTQSIKEKGVLQPILARPQNSKFEVVAGHRRRQGAIDAGLKEIPAIVKELSDEEALEIQVIENSHREDPNPMEEAWGFQRLIEMGKHTPETLSAKIDHSEAYVVGRIRLLQLPKEAQGKILKGEISLGHALLLSRLRHPSEQKELLKMITENEGMTIKQALSEVMNFSRNISDAIFDTEACKKCPYLSSNQSLLFPELKKSGECMDRGCFSAKIGDHYKAIIEERKAEGFKILTRAEDLPRNPNKIVPPGVKDYSAVNPNKYKSECMKCFENHVFFMYEKEGYNGKEVRSGEICLNKKCLDKMQGLADRKRKREEDDQDTEDNLQGNNLWHAEACRNRFLWNTLPPRVEKSPTLQTRLLIYHLLDHLGHIREREEIIRSYFPDYRSGDDWHDHRIYRFIHEFPEDKLNEALQKILVSTIEKTDPLVLLQMTKEAGIDINRDFGADEIFLKTKTKAELIGFAKKFGLEISLTEVAKKGEIIEAILKHELRGKIPDDIIRACKIEDGDIASRLEEDDEDETDTEVEE